MRVLPGAALVAAALLALTGCGSQATEETASPSVTVAPTTSAPPASPTASASATASATPDAPETEEPTAAPVETGGGAPAGQCSDDALGIRIDRAPDGGGAGSEYYQVVFTNTGGSTCALRGTPGVSVVGNGDGTQLGKPAARDQAGVRTVRLGIGLSVAAPLKVVNIGTDGGPLEGCSVQRGDGYRVYAPHSRKAVLVRDATAVACVRGPSFMDVGPVVPYTG
ncbi:DUF4232 domain-containing protein [Amnibacterium soli]